MTLRAVTCLLATLALLPRDARGQATPQLPPLPADVPAHATIHYWVTSGSPRAQQAVWRDASGTLPVEGDPTQNISDIRRTRLVIKDGAVIDVAGLYREMGVAPGGG